MKVKKQIIPLSLVALLAGNADIAYSSWLITTGDKSADISNDSSASAPVCYSYLTSSGSSSTKTYYASLGKALDKCNDSTAHTIVMIPGDSTTIYTYSGTHTLGSNDTLILPYTAETYEPSSDSELKYDKGSNFADQNSSTNRKCQLIMKSNSSLTVSNLANLYIGGIRGTSGAFSGATTHDYAEIVMENSSTITNYGTIKCLGYIKNYTTSSSNTKTLSTSTKISIESTGMIYTPMVVYDWAQGSNTIQMAFGGYINALASKVPDDACFPFTQFDFPNIRPMVEVSYGGSYIGQVYFYGQSIGHINKEINIVGSSSDSLFQTTTSEDALTISFADTNLEKTAKSDTSHKNTISFNGNINFEMVTLPVSVATIDSSKYYMPIPAMFDIYIESGVFNVNKRIKFMPGSSITINDGAEFNLNANTMFYQSNTCNETTVYNANTSFTEAAKCFNNGTTNISANFSGYIQTKKNNSKIITSPTFTTPSDSYEYNGSNQVQFVFPATFDKADDESGTNLSKSASLEVGKAYKSANEGSNYFYYEMVDNTLKGVSINPISGSSVANSSKSYTLNAVLTPIEPDEINDLVYTWKTSDSTNSYFGSTSGTSSATGSSVEFTTTANSSTDSDATVKVTLTVTSKTDSFLNFTADGTYTRTKSCIIEGILITMEDGTKKPVEFVASGDEVLVFNHETGRIETSKVVFNDHNEAEAKQYMIVWCEFSNGSRIGVVSEHGFFCFEENKYIYINETNYASYIGKHFITFDASGNKKIVELINSYIEKKICKVYSPVTKSTLNYFTEGVLSMPGGISGLFNIFDYDSTTLKYDEAKKQADIDKYGLLTLDDFGGQIDEFMFDAFNGKYLGISIGKGMLTWERIEELIKRYAPLCK